MSGLGTSEMVRLSAPNINAKNTGATTIATTENGTQRFIPLAIIVELTAANTVAVACTLSVGTNGATYNNILAATAMTGLTALNGIVVTNLPVTVISSVAPNTAVAVNVTVGATATTATIRVDVIGFYV